MYKKVKFYFRDGQFNTIKIKLVDRESNYNNNFLRLLETINIEQIKKIARQINLVKNDFFVKENEICDQIGIVESGTLFGYFEDSEANLIVNELYSKNSFITSYRSFLIGIPSPSIIKAYSNSVIYVIDKYQYNELIQQNEWSLIFKNISDQLFINKCFKETALIKLKAKERYLELIEKRKNLEQDFPQHLIASYLKIRPETLSRIKSLDLHQDKM